MPGKAQDEVKSAVRGSAKSLPEVAACEMTNEHQREFTVKRMIKSGFAQS